jgi:DNA polymerase IV (DinB-like DNA polymerase)
MHIDLDYFYAQCEEVRRPELRGRPVVVCIYSGRSEDSGAVSTSNYTARKLGIRSGMPIIQAKRIAPQNAVFLGADLDYYDTVSDRIMGLLRSFSPVMEQASVDEAYLDFTGIVSGKDEAEERAREIKRKILDSEGLTCSVGIGPNKLLSKMAAGINKPDGLTAVSEDAALDFLGGMEVGKLFGVGRVTGARLNEMGIRTISELREVEIGELRKEFGAGMGSYLFNASRGIDNEPVKERRREQYGRIITLKEDTRDRNAIVENAMKLMENVVQSARADGVKFKTVSFIGIMEDLATRTKNRSLPDFVDDFALCSRLVPQLVDDFLSEHEGKLRRLGVKISNLSERGGQKSLSDFA